MLITSLVTLGFQSRSPLISPNIGSLPQPCGFFHHLHLPWWDCAGGECRLHRRRRRSWRTLCRLYSCSCDKLSPWYVSVTLTLSYLWSQPSQYSSMMLLVYTWLHLVMYGRTWFYVVAPSVTFLNHRVPLATVFTTRCSYIYQHKREMCTESVRGVGIFMCKGH